MRRRAVSKALGAVAEARASIPAHRGRVVPKLDARRPPPAEGEATFTYDGYFDHMDHELATVQQRLTAAEDAHQRKLAQAVRERRESTELTGVVYGKQTAARQVLGGYHGEDRSFEVAAVSGPTPQVAQPLAEQVDQTVKSLRNPQVGLLAGRIAGVSIDREAMADDLESDLALLVAAREAYQRTRKEIDGTRQVLNAALVEFHGVFPWVARTLEAFFILAGERELAERIRTTRRRLKRRSKGGEEEDESGEPPAEDGSATESEVSETAPQSSES